MPDVFVPCDTSGFSDYYFKIRDRALMYQFALNIRMIIVYNCKD